MEYYNKWLQIFDFEHPCNSLPRNFCAHKYIQGSSLKYIIKNKEIDTNFFMPTKQKIER